MDGNGLDIDSLVRPERVHRRVYADPAIFELEMDRIFGRAWIYVGHESQVAKPGDFFRSRVGRQPVVMARHDDGRVYVSRQARTAGLATRWESSRPRDGWITSVAFDPNDRNTIYATYGWFGGPHVYKSTDGGRSWQGADGVGSTALPDVPMHVVVVDRDRGGRVYLGTDAGVFVSDDGGNTWAVENTGYGAIVTESLSLVRDASDQTWLFAFTHGRGAWKVRVR